MFKIMSEKKKFDVKDFKEKSRRHCHAGSDRSRFATTGAAIFKTANGVPRLNKMAQKLEEGAEFVRQAEKCLKTHFLKWRPDYDVAAEKYQQAALCFRTARAFDKSKDCLLRAADCYQQNLALFHAAKCLDQVTLLAKDLNEYQHVLDLGLRASYLFLQYGSPEAAVNSLEKAGKILEPLRPEQSVKLYQRAAEILKNEDNMRQAAEFLNRASRIMVRLKMYDQAADAIRCEIRMHEDEDNCAPVGRLLVGLILVHLTREDCVAAEKAFRQWGNYCQPPERLNLETLLRGYDEEDPDIIKRCLEHPFIKHMDVEYAKLAKNMPIFKEECQFKGRDRLRTAMTAYERELLELSQEASLTGAGGNSAKGLGESEGKQEEVNEEEEGLC